MWLIEALKHDFDVTVVTTGGWDLAGTEQLLRDASQQRGSQGPHRTGSLHLVKGLSAAALRGACYQRFADKSQENTTFA